MNQNWKEIKSNVRTFLLEGEPEIIHIVKTAGTSVTEGQVYTVLSEDFIGMDSQGELLTKEQIEQKYNIKL